MKALLKEAPGQGATLTEAWPEPAVGETDVLIRVEEAAICGTDLHLYDWDASATAFHPKLPLVMGHECTGTVVEVGAGAHRVHVGDRVSLETHIPCGDCFQCRTGQAHNCTRMGLLGLTVAGAFAELVRVPEVVCFKLPEAISSEEGALFEPAGVAVHAMQRASITPGDTVLVCGCGFIGLVAVQLAFLSGAARVIALDVRDQRLERARQLGAIGLNPRHDSVSETVHELCSNRGGVDVAFEMSGSEAVYPDIFGYIRREGTLISVGHPGKPVQIDVAEHINKQGVVFKGVFGRRIWDTWEILAALVSAGRLDLTSLVTHRLTLSDYREAFTAVKESGIKGIFHIQA